MERERKTEQDKINIPKGYWDSINGNGFLTFNKINIIENRHIIFVLFSTVLIQFSYK